MFDISLRTNYFTFHFNASSYLLFLLLVVLFLGRCIESVFEDSADKFFFFFFIPEVIKECEVKALTS